jgi:hypothetical protein
LVQSKHKQAHCWQDAQSTARLLSSRTSVDGTLWLLLTLQLLAVGGPNLGRGYLAWMHQQGPLETGMPVATVTAAVTAPKFGKMRTSLAIHLLLTNSRPCSSQFITGADSCMLNT